MMENNKVKCTVKYSDGTEEDLRDTFNLHTYADIKDHKYEMKLLQYFYRRDYELICTGGSLPYEYYFKHK